MSKTNQILLAVWLLIAAFTGYLAAGIVASRQSTERRITDEALSYARLVEQHASAAFDRADAALVGVMDHVGPADLAGTGGLPDARRREIEALLRSQQQRTAGLITTFVAGPDGRVVAISLGAPPGTDLSDREYFRIVKQQNRTTPVISEAVRARVSKRWGTVIVRRVNSLDGGFGGMVGANLGLEENFLDFYSTLSLGKDSTVSLRDAEGGLLVRYPEAEAELGKKQAPGTALDEHIRAGQTEGIVVATSAIDGVERAFGFRKLARYPVYAIVGLSLEDALSVWRRDRNIELVAALLVVLAGVFITVALRRKERADRDLRDLNEHLEARVRERTEELSRSNLRLEGEIAERERAEASALEYADRLALMTRRTVNLLEDERRRLARELHDRVSSNLTAIGLNLSNIEGALSQEEQDRFGNALSDCSALAADSAASARDISSDLHPAILDYMGIVPALHDLGEKFGKRTGIAVAVKGPGEARRLSPDKEIALYRIAQEALVNCAKHSGASAVAIRVDQHFQGIELSIKDDGVGFDTDRIRDGARAPGLGLLSMRERAQAVGATCRIESKPGQGTIVVVQLPDQAPITSS